MNIRTLVYLVKFSLVLLSMVAMAQSSYANTIRYSWSGLLVPNSIDDPWSIGAGEPFQLDMNVFQSATDLSNQSIGISSYEVVDATLLIGETQVGYHRQLWRCLRFDRLCRHI
jgi:hypothetical protein